MKSETLEQLLENLPEDETVVFRRHEAGLKILREKRFPDGRIARYEGFITRRDVLHARVPGDVLLAGKLWELAVNLRSL